MKNSKMMVVLVAMVAVFGFGCASTGGAGGSGGLVARREAVQERAQEKREAVKTEVDEALEKLQKRWEALQAQAGMAVSEKARELRDEANRVMEEMKERAQRKYEEAKEQAREKVIEALKQ